MQFLAGEELNKDEKLRCERCSHELQVPKGGAVPKCPQCGHDIFSGGEPTGNGQG